MNEEPGDVGVPMVKEDKDKESEVELDRSAARQYRGITARMNYLGWHRSKIQPVVKQLSRNG